jgi:hypothetical protein
MLSQPIPKSLEIYSSFELKKMDANNAALAMVLRLDLPRVEVPSDSYRDHSAARQNIEGRMTNDDRTCGTAAAGPQAEAFEGHGPRLRTALTCTARADAGMLATERRRTELADDRHRSSATLQADDPSMPAVQSQAEIHTSSRHRAERRKSHANRLGPRPRRAHSVSSRNQYGRIELRGAASSVSAQAIFLPGTAGTSRRCSCSPPSISAAAHDDQLSVAERCDLSIVLRTLS